LGDVALGVEDLEEELLVELVLITMLF
jgi:hypothetical protein